MKWLGFRVPLSIVNKAHQANQLYPFAMSLFESVRTYHQTLDKIEERPSISLLVAGLHKEVQNLIAEVRYLYNDVYTQKFYVCGAFLSFLLHVILITAFRWSIIC